MKNEQDITKLPRWAQDRIRITEMRLQEARLRIDQMFGAAETDTTMQDYPESRKLPKGANIRFALDKHEWVDVRIRDGRVLVMGSYAINLHPEAANTLTIGILK